MYTKKEVIEKMANSLIDKAKEYQVSLKGITINNFNLFLDDLFNDGGEIRCIHFIDLADYYALQFGEFESVEYENARWKCVKGAIACIKRTIKHDC